MDSCFFDRTLNMLLASRYCPLYSVVVMRERVVALLFIIMTKYDSGQVFLMHVDGKSDDMHDAPS